MSRAAFYDALIADPVLNSLGINDDTVWHNYSSEERPSNTTPFIILRWGPIPRPRWQSVRSPEQLTLWVHQPVEMGSDFTPLNAILDAVDDATKQMHDLPGIDGYTLAFVEIGDRSGDLLDDGFNTLTKNAGYELHSQRSIQHA
ncbi:tail terminator [Mycobacterium phage Indlulamithi]|uniref:Tail terminator n=1 Tax=Mycobacterium phage Indlulamithi TaxID=2656582 RepID=A0A649VD68_9CAUD|nr:tail terminator [Mycobacterium phage Indlulamithi]QGJ90059.1 tail terminator [Mycobacterium phage Indlulamithi]